MPPLRRIENVVDVSLFLNDELHSVFEMTDEEFKIYRYKIAESVMGVTSEVKRAETVYVPNREVRIFV